MEFIPISLNEIRPYLRFVLFTKEMHHSAYVVGMEHRIIFVADGEGDILVDGKAFELKKNDLFYISAGVPYKISASGTAQIIFLNFDLSMKNSDKRGQYRAVPFSNSIKSGEEFLCPYRLYEDDSEIRFLRLSASSNTVREALNIAEYFEKGEGGSYKDDILSGDMIGLISKILMRVKTDINKKSFMAVAELAVQYIQKNYAKKISVSDVADALSFHQSHLNRCMQKTFNTSTYDYLLKYRLEKAMELLIYTNDSVSNIAEAVGFLEPRGFSTAFKKYFGVSPTMIRK